MRMRLQASFPTKSLIRLKKQFRDHVHATYDLRFMVRFVTIQPRAFFDQFDPNSKQKLRMLEKYPYWLRGLGSLLAPLHGAPGGSGRRDTLMGRGRATGRPATALGGSS